MLQTKNAFKNMNHDCLFLAIYKKQGERTKE